MPFNERPTHFPTKGIPMFLDMFFALITFLMIGVAFNIIGHLVNK